MIGVSAIIFVFLPETPWYLVSKGKLDQAKKVLTKMHGRKQGYDSQEQVVGHTSLEVSTFELISAGSHDVHHRFGKSCG